MTKRVLDLLFGKALRRQTARYLEDLANAPERTARAQTSALLQDLARCKSAIVLGETEWSQKVQVPLEEFTSGHSLITGGSGAGKTRYALLIVKALIDKLPDIPLGFGILDPKGETFDGVLAMLAGRLVDLDRSDPKSAELLRQRIVIIDFSSKDPVSPYNVISRPDGVERELFSGNRTDQMLDLLPGNDNLSLTGGALLRRCILLLSAHGLPISWINELLNDEGLRGRLVARSRDADTAVYFARIFPDVPKQTVGALSRRMEGLVASEAVRLALNGNSAPDFRALQDSGKIILVRCSGAALSGSVRRLLQAVVFADVAQSVFARRGKDPFLWVCDESQRLCESESLKDHMTHLVQEARSYRSFFMFLTQNASTAIRDTRLLSIVNTNIRWSFSMRGEPDDCAFLQTALEVSGRKSKPQQTPFDGRAFYSISEERKMEWAGVANLADRTGYFWLRSRPSAPIKIRTADLVLPHDEASQRVLEQLRLNPSVGMRVSRTEQESNTERQRREWQPQATRPLNISLSEVYQRNRMPKQ